MPFPTISAPTPFLRVFVLTPAWILWHLFYIIFSQFGWHLLGRCVHRPTCSNSWDQYYKTNFWCSRKENSDLLISSFQIRPDIYPLSTTHASQTTGAHCVFHVCELHWTPFTKRTHCSFLHHCDIVSWIMLNPMMLARKFSYTN